MRTKQARRELPPSDGPIYLGVIGCGQWGPNHIRTFNSLPESRVLLCSDLDPIRLERMRLLYPQTRGTLDHREVLASPHVQAVVISTPTGTHRALVTEALEAGKDVLVEKPLADTLDGARRLEALARRRGRILMVGHTFLFNAGILKVRDYIRRGVLGRILYLHATRTNLGPIRSDVSAVWDLASHDVSIMNFLLGGPPRSVSARGEIFIQRGIHDVAFITLSYPGKTLVHIPTSPG